MQRQEGPHLSVGKHAAQSDFRPAAELLHVPYRGTTLALNALVAGHID